MRLILLLLSLCLFSGCGLITITNAETIGEPDEELTRKEINRRAECEDTYHFNLEWFCKDLSDFTMMQECNDRWYKKYQACLRNRL